jgi:hypothetical protein
MTGLFARHADVEGHFSGDAAPGKERRLFQHMKGCARCRDEYRTLAMLEALEGDGADRARDRLARGLFATPAQTSTSTQPRSAWRFGGGLAAAFACVALVVTVGRAPASFRARGGLGALEAPAPALAIYRVPRDRDNPERLAVGDTQRAGSVVRAGESLAFSYVNPAPVGDCCLLVFARDAAGHVFWFWPAWNDAADDPTSLPIASTAEPVELTEAVRQPLEPGALTIVGLFTPRPLHVRQVEAAVAKGLEGLQAFEGHLWTETLEVTP